MLLRNKKRVNYDYSAYIPSSVDDDDCEYDKIPVIFAFCLYMCLIGVAVVGCTVAVNLNIKQPTTQHKSIYTSLPSRVIPVEPYVINNLFVWKYGSFLLILYQ